MSNRKLSFEEWAQRRKIVRAVIKPEEAWNFCETQKNAEIGELRLKFKDATSLYTNEIVKLEKENSELKEKNKNLQCALDESTNEDPFRFTSYCQGIS